MSPPLRGHAFGIAALFSAWPPLALALDPDASPPTAAPTYGRDVRPILSDRCVACDGPDAAKRQAKLRLGTCEGATAKRRSGAAIVPGDPDASFLLERIHSDDEDERKPPVDSGRRAISNAERETLRRWIEDGAQLAADSAYAQCRPMPNIPGDDAWRRELVPVYVRRTILAASRGEGPVHHV